MTMKTTGEVVGLKHEDGLFDHDWVVVTLKLWVGGGKVRLRLRPHEARPYVLGRRVDVEINPQKKWRGGGGP
jgi:hypothetical protein